jgi:PPE-repeat protein
LAAAAYEQAYAMTVPPPAIAANRAQLLSLVRTNVIGQNAPAIAATQAQYSEMWAQNTLMMHIYAAQSAVAAKLKPIAPPPRTTNSAGGATQGAADPHTAATLASTPNALQMLSAPDATHTGTTPTTPSASPSGVSSYQGLTATNATLSNLIHTANFGARSICAVWRGTPGMVGAGNLAGLGVSGIERAAGAEVSGLGNLGGLGASGAGLGGGPVAGGLGQANAVGALSVPPAWAPAAPAAETTFGPVSGVTWEATNGAGMSGQASSSAPAGVPGMPGVPAAGVSGRGFAAPRYGVKLTVMPRIPGLG